MWWDLIGTIVLSVGIGVLAQPQLSVRFMTVKSDRELNRGVMIGAIFIMLMTGVAFVVGAMSNVWFFQEFGTMALGAPEIGGKADAVIPFYIKQNFPEWFRAVFLITLLSAAMSTMSSQFHTMGSAIGHDILDKGFGIKAKRPITIIRIAMLFSIAIATLVAWFLPGLFKDGTTVIASGTALFFGLCAGSFLSIYILGIFWKGATRQGAVAGFCAGLGISILVLLFSYEKVSASLGLCKAIFGQNSIFSGTIYKTWDPLLFAVPISMLTAWIVSLCTPKFDSSHQELCIPKKIQS
jgi:SSS family solute:Na+ symporter